MCQDIPAEVAAIETWLESNGYEIGLRTEEDPYKIGAMREQDGHEFELNIECNYYQGVVIIAVQCADEINPNRYLFLLPLLNCLNISEELTKFTLDPLTRKLCCKSVIGISCHTDESYEIQDRLEIYIVCAIRDMTRIINILG